MKSPYSLRRAHRPHINRRRRAIGFVANDDETFLGAQNVQRFRAIGSCQDPCLIEKGVPQPTPRLQALQPHRTVRREADAIDPTDSRSLPSLNEYAEAIRGRSISAPSFASTLRAGAPR